ncbi:Longin-like domain-containing protein [Zopfochytrium polystomum]|nr:Longin-like domain-containing protein [Zopfochytrium polystomum]
MVKSTIIARVVDGLPLAASMDDEESENLSDYKNQAKLLFKRLSSADAEQRCSVETGPYVFHYLIEFNICYLTLCDRSYPKKLAFAYLTDLQKEFQQLYGREVGTVARPYAFVKFDTFIQKTKKQYKNPSSAGGGPNNNLTKLNEELHDVHRIMTKNISDVLGRGEALDRMQSVSSRLRDETDKYKKKARGLNWLALYHKYGPPAIVGGVILLVLLLRFYWW